MEARRKIEVANENPEMNVSKPSPREAGEGGADAIRVFVADDHPLVLEGVKAIIQITPGMEVAGEASNGVDAVNLLRASPVDVAVLDICMDGMSGLEVLEIVHTEQPKTAVIMLSMHDEECYALRALKGGASGYLTKKRTPDELVEAILTVSQGRVYVASTVARRMSMLVARGREGPSHEVLSNREFQVMLRIARGMTLEQCARDLFLSPKTVSTYRTRILEKMGFIGNVDLTRYVMSMGLLDWSERQSAPPGCGS